MNQELESRGFLVLRGAVPPAKVQEAMDTIDVEAQTMNYERMRAFIEGNMMETLRRELKWENPSFAKYRVSDRSNAADASTFHRDCFPQAEDALDASIYTCLMYMDRTVMELVPGTHRAAVMSPLQALTAYHKAERIEMRPGDVLIFHAFLLHRGIFTEKLPHRRLIQVFEVFPDDRARQIEEQRLLHWPSQYASSASAVAIWASQWSVVITPINWVGYMNAATGYGFRRRPLEKVGLGTYSILSSEGLRSRLTVEPGTFQPLNFYVLATESTIRDVPAEVHDRLYHDCYIIGRNFYGFMLVLMAVILLALMYRVVKAVLR